MAKRYKLRELEQKHGDLEKVILPLVNSKSQQVAAQVLETSQATISNWLKANKYRKQITYVKEQTS